MAKKKASPEISAVDLFCGVGGLTHGLVRGGIDVRAGVDVDPNCKFPYEANNKSSFLELDVDSLTADDIEPFLFGAKYSLLAGCAPCQPFSSYSQSRRAGVNFDKADDGNLDWKLVASFGRLVKEVQPDLVTMENVAQLAAHPVFDDFLKSLDGYHVWWKVVECSAIGVPQSRKRLVLIASRLGEIEVDLSSYADSQKTVRRTIFSLPQIEAGEQHGSDPLHYAPTLSALNTLRIKASKPGGSWRDWPEDLQATCHRKASGATYPSVYGRMEWDKVAPTITTQCFGYGNGRFGHPEQDRAISLREAAMLQTFPQAYKFVRPGDRVHFSRLGRLIGNAVPVRLGEVIAGVLVSHIAKIAAAKNGLDGI
ncbi:MAG: DNA cytosine methyltransferase [Actinophytocola sp.]|uniref:DNA cytosine methyltransferase n=1 Tax=Actinophytocola sp. TaxID=1872138 RepID=UPI003C727A6E